MKRHLETPFKTTLCITQTCNLDCRHCYADCSTDKQARELSRDEWLGFIDYLVENNFIQIYIEGGEPFHRPDFTDILAYCCRKLMTLVRTNGTLIDRAMAQELKRLGVGRVFVDLMGARAKTHDEFAGVPGSFDKACNAIRWLLEAGVPTDILTIVNRANVGELQALLNLAGDLGVQRVGLLRLYPLGRVKRQWTELSLGLSSQMEAIAALKSPDGVSVMQSWHPRDRNCCWQAAAVSPFGDSIGCAYLREYVNFGSIRETPFLDIWRNSALYKQLRSGQVEKSCPDCSANEGTDGGCRAAAFAFYGRWTAPDPFCVKLNDGTALDVLPSRLLPENT